MIAGLLQRIRFALSPPALEIRIAAGEARPHRGTVKRGFLEDCNDIARDYGIRSGRIFGLRKSGRIRLEFSPEIPSAAHQRLRNAYHFHR
jgi:hypothetical protein